MSSAKVVCCIYLLTLLTKSKEANSVDPDQTANVGTVWSGSTMLVIAASKALQRTTFVAIVALGGKGLRRELFVRSGSRDIIRGIDLSKALLLA